MKHSPMILYINLWWIVLLIAVQNSILKKNSPCLKASLPRQNPLKFFHWNTNSILAHNGIRLRCIEAINVLQKYDVIAIIESALQE